MAFNGRWSTLERYTHTLEKDLDNILDLHPIRLLPGHGQPIGSKSDILVLIRARQTHIEQTSEIVR